MMCSTVAMDQQQFISQQSQLSGAAATTDTSNNAGDAAESAAGELQVDISQMDFQTIKAASDTLKVCYTHCYRTIHFFFSLVLLFCINRFRSFVCCFVCRKIPKCNSANRI